MHHQHQVMFVGNDVCGIFKFKNFKKTSRKEKKYSREILKERFKKIERE